MPNAVPNVGVITMLSTHYYLIDCQGGKLMYEAGWVGKMPMLLRYLRAYGVAPAEIKYVMYSHNHTDHADLVQEVKQKCGARLVIHEAQIPHLPWMEAWHARKGEPFTPIRVEQTDLIVRGPHPRIPAVVGLGGYVVHTPGHGADHITLLLDDGRAFTGDLHTPDLTGLDNYPIIQECWRTLVKLGARSFYPAHGEPYGLEKVEGHL